MTIQTVGLIGGLDNTVGGAVTGDPVDDGYRPEGAIRVVAISGLVILVAVPAIYQIYKWLAS